MRGKKGERKCDKKNEKRQNDKRQNDIKTK